MPDPNLIPLTAVLRELDLPEGSPRQTYREVWNLAVNDEIPAQQIRGRWHALRSDLPEIAAALGMVVREPASASTARHSKAVA